MSITILIEGAQVFAVNQGDATAKLVVVADGTIAQRFSVPTGKLLLAIFDKPWQCSMKENELQVFNPLKTDVDLCVLRLESGQNVLKFVRANDSACICEIFVGV